MHIIPILLTTFFLFSVPAHAQLKNENLLVAMPDGYVVGFQDKNAKQQMTEMVPRGQSVKDWTDMVTVQIFFNMTNVTPEAYKQRLEKLWTENCKGAESSPIGQGNERGYPVIVWLQFCPLNKDTGKPEVTLLKAIAGKDSFYVVQKAFRFQPDKPQVEQWSRYLRSVSVCDSRVPDRACPQTGK
ncbi:hypothetical protein [Pseudorhodoplanes sp.]|uniref:hypothetical protein n=1 Tax=Pseudorhodoplanes sp. TaxID=1934341 RepID=UPI002C50B31C|nr:hypothetical protein [Pseudorhodoplanes sp.]HWV52071.1 hypothetical protein [Pseudorhodoplanes sp.]